MNSNKQVPITRINKFFSGIDNELEISMGREYVEGDGNFTIILYRVNRALTQSDNIYGEAVKDGIRFFPPVELKVMPTIGDPDNQSYNQNGTLRNKQDGLLTFGIYDAQLEELKVEISFGDYIGYPVNEHEIRYYSVTDDGTKNYDNRHTIMGYKSAFRTVKCAPVDTTEFTSK